MLGPARFAIIVLVLAGARRFLLLSVTMTRLLAALEQVLLIVVIAWLAVRVAESFEEVARNPNRIEQARKFGASDGVNSRDADWKRQLMALTDGWGVDVAVAAGGLPETFETPTPRRCCCG